MDPFVSVVMPVRNEAGHLRETLGAVLVQDYPPERIEIFVADGLSSDGTRQLVKNLQKTHPHLYLVDNPSRIVATGLNTTLHQVKGEIIVRVDGHTVVSPDYVRQCVNTLQKTGADNVGGRMNAVGSTPFANSVAAATSSPFGVGGARFHYSKQEEWVDTVYMVAWPRDVFEKIGLFDEELVRNQDDEFNYRLREKGGKIFLNPTIKSEYFVRSNPKALWHQYFQYGFWKVRVLQKHPHQMSLRQFVPPVFVLTLLLSILCALIPVLRPLSILVPITYLLANFGVSLYTALNRGWQSLPVLPLVFSILHISYGLGFLWGLVKFANRWGDKQGKTPAYEVN